MIVHFRHAVMMVLLSLLAASTQSAVRSAKDFYNPELPTCGIEEAIPPQW
jgi:hypothetical protein